MSMWEHLIRPGVEVVFQSVFACLALWYGGADRNRWWVAMGVLAVVIAVSAAYNMGYDNGHFVAGIAR